MVVFDREMILWTFIEVCFVLISDICSIAIDPQIVKAQKKQEKQEEKEEKKRCVRLCVCVYSLYLFYIFYLI